MIIFMAVEVVKKEVLVHPRKTPPKQSLDGAPSTWIALEWATLPSNSLGRLLFQVLGELRVVGCFAPERLKPECRTSDL